MPAAGQMAGGQMAAVEEVAEGAAEGAADVVVVVKAVR